MNQHNNYVPYHMHTYYSLLDSCTPPEDYVKRAAECGMTCLGWSEHGNIFNWFEKKQLCDKYGIKYLHGIECYVTETLDEKRKDNWHTVLIAKNKQGFVEINQLFFKSYQPDHFYYKPRITVDEFLAISDNVIKISACIQSPLWQFRKAILMDEVKNHERMARYVQICKHYDYYEIQYHCFQDNLEYTKYLWELSKRFHKSLIVGTDTHSLNKYKAECRTILQYGKTDNAWGDPENECDLTFKTYDELVEKFREQNVLPMNVVLEAIENTNVMANSCEALTFDTHDKYPFLYGDRDEEIMWKKIKRNYKEKRDAGIISHDIAYVNQLKEEMAVFKKVNMVGFMLFMSEMMTWARENHIATGFSRGSVSGSMVAYITNITDVDPIKWNTIFSRFCNEHRVEAGDIDTDWYEDDRQKIYDYIINRFGVKRTAYILALGTMADKSAIAVICKALRNIDKDSPYTLEQMEYIKAEYTDDPEGTKAKYPEVFYYFDGLKDCVVSQSQHPAGIIAAPMDLIDYCGMFLGSDGQQILPLDMEMCHALGLIKYDILGLKTIGVIDKTCKMIGKYFPKANEIDFADQAVYDDMAKNPLTIFQFESQYAMDCFKKMNCRSIDDITLVNAALRPGGASYRDRLFNHEMNDNGSEIINNILKESYGYLCLDEHQIIPTTQGIKPINEIKINDEVYTQNGINPVTNIFDKGYDTTYKLHTIRGDIICTKNHEILTQDGWHTLEEIMQSPDYYSIATRINDCGNEHYNLDELRLLGWLTGDGILHHDKLKNLVTFVNANHDIIQAFKQTVEKLYNELTCTISDRKSRVNKLPLYYAIVVWKHKQMRDKPICDMLKKFDLYNKIAQEKEVPYQLFNADKESILTYLGAYTDTDCHIDCQAIVYHCASERLILGIQELYRKIGYSSTYHKNSNKDYTLVINNVKNVLMVLQKYSIAVAQFVQQNEDAIKNIRTCSYNSMISKTYVQNVITNKQVTFRTKDKIKFSIINAKYVSYDMIKRIVYDTNLNFTMPSLLCNEDLLWTPIKSIELYNENSHIYDLEIANEHNFAVTGGLIVHNCYQEQVTAFLQYVCGFSGSDADSIRRAIGKKDQEKIAKALPQILEGYCTKSDKPREIAEQEARNFLQVIEDASSYMFNKNHALGYSLLSYLCGYYRYYYPVQYCTAYLSCAKNDDDLFNGQQLARDFDIKLQSVKFRFADWDYSCNASERMIYKGLREVPRMSESACTALRSLYFNEYATFNDLLKDMVEVKLNVAQLENLIKLDYFEEFGDINYLLEYLKLYKKYQHRKKRYELIAEDIVNVPKNITSVYEKIQYSYDVLGMVSIVYTGLADNYYFVTEIKGTKYSLYQISTGKTVQYRIRGALSKQSPVKVTDIIRIDKINQEGKWRKGADDKWFQSNTEMEDIIKAYVVVKKS